MAGSRFWVVFLVALVLGLVIGGTAATRIEDRGDQAKALALSIQAGQLFDNGQFDKAIGLAYQAIAYNPNDYSPYNLLGHAHEKQGKKELALEAYEIALRNTLKGASLYKREATTVQSDRHRIELRIQALR